MTFKNIFGSKFASTKDAPDDKSKAAPGSDKAATKSKAAPAKAAPEKSS
jgi:hypothetical protein